jgi:hypothetical protein
MTQTSAEPPAGPEDEGLPDYADDTSTAFDEADRPRFSDSPPALPADNPQGVEEYGVTAAEARRAEPLDQRLLREEPDTPVDDPLSAPGSGLADEATGEAAADQAGRDADALGVDPEPLTDPESATSGYDMGEAGGAVGRLVAPDLGGYADTEGTEIAVDTGEAGGLTAEEAAMHSVPEADVPYVE